ncbi:MAG TPA: hypothetical protein VK939_03965 [Longimicrobiales bacterium]|nr:hypothetical protein [Longimicrobiales bacterium]
MKRTAITVLLTLLLAGGAFAQEPVVRFRGRGHPATDAKIRDWLAEPGRLVWTGDTTIARTDTVRAPVLIVGGTVRIEGTMLGELAGVGADLFVRPSARLHGDVFNVAGGYYVSDLATVSGSVDDRPNAPYELERRPGEIHIIGTEQRSALLLEGIYGLTPPTYDRVDGASLRWAASLALPTLGRTEPRLRGWAGYRSERGAFDGGGELIVARGFTELGFGAERTTLTNEHWIRSDFTNSVAYLFQGKDVRDYHQADRVWAELRRTVERGERTTSFWVRGQVEEATSLRADDPWSLFSRDSVRTNFPIDDGRIASVRAGTDVLWEQPTFTLRLLGELEAAGEPLDGEHEFTRYQLTGDWAMLAFADHTLEVEWHVRGPLPGTETLPRQRWSHLGGSGTLYTFNDAQFRGDRVVFVETSYGIPLGERLRVAYLGVPTVELLHAAGMAWTAGQSRSLEQNVGLRLKLGMFYVCAVTNPDDFGADAEFAVGVTLSRKSHPWQASGGFF